ncbi:hypothetical protein [Seonamhaeicola maritimus]|uniref:Uncharacterized protein n=1 Tax=Seonamhaeicola maritimus TaxID=2591822 RepID=A0A5C7GJA3_9FLAO|nr:hypothetical protein [Seonamhaeicola maritimus]TXG37245.1 hypothetical protein FUA22_11835 [Seonamhaeicola maritimus]
MNAILKTIVSVLLVSITPIVYASTTFIQNDSIRQKAKYLSNKANEIRHKYPDSSLVLFQKSYEELLKSGDTIEAVKALMSKADIFENNANYSKSYDAYWNALMLTDNLDNKTIKSLIYHRLGRVYSYYKREDEALKYLNKALEIQKELVKKEVVNKSFLVPYYYFITSTNRELGNVEIAKKYLDSCYMFLPKDDTGFNRESIDFEKVFVLSEMQQPEKALEVAHQILPHFEKNNRPYLVLIYKQIGDIHLKMDNLNEGELYYNKALEISKEYNSHIDFTPLVYEKLTELFLKKNNYPKAFENLKIAKELDRKFFDSRSSNNQSLLEIKDSYRLEKQRQEQQIQKQYLKQLEQEEKIGNLQRIILLVSVIFIAIIAFVYVKHLRAKHKAEKVLIRKNQELENKKTQELLELKNKELAASALQLIEKDEFLRTLKDKVRGKDEKIKVHEVNKVLRSISVSNNQNWEEFKLRFVDVNKDFYNKVFEKYPNLSQGDQKICALIKLNFSSKEMARLLGISVESVHTSRHRIRKKMNLPRSVNLEDFINSL